MALTLGEVVTELRLRHPAYGSDVVLTRQLASALGRIQRTLAQEGTRRYSGFLSQRFPIVLDLSASNRPATVGAGTPGGLPSGENSSGSIVVVEGGAGSLMTYDLADAAIQFGDFVPTSVGALTVTFTGAGRTVNADAGLALQIVAGPGFGPDAVRTIDSNTADTWTLSDAFTTLPTTASVLRLISLPAANASSETGGAIVGIPSVQNTVGYLVRINSAGTAYLDLTKPLIATQRCGMPLPPHDRLLWLDAVRDPAQAIQSNTAYPIGPWQADIPIYHQARRMTGGRCAWVLGNEMFFGAFDGLWAGITSLELALVPIPPLFDGSDRDVLETPFLLPDTAFGALAAQGAAVCARLAQAKGVQTVNPAAEQADADRETANWLASLGQRATALRRLSTRNR